MSLAVSGSGSARVVVTAYADEDTTRSVGSGTITVTEAGPAELVFGVTEPPYVDVDGVAACSLDVLP